MWYNMFMGYIIFLLFFTGCSGPTDLPADRESLEVNSFTVFEENSIGNTGLTFDSKTGLLVHARYDYEKSSKLIFTDLQGNHLVSIDVTALIDHIQGLAYDYDRDTFWVWGTTKGIAHKPFTQDISLIEVDRSANLLDEIVLPSFVNYPGMIHYAGNRRMWVKANTKTEAYLFDMNTWEIISTVDTRIGGEGIAQDKDGFLWVHDGKALYQVDSGSGKRIRKIDSPTERGQSEGLTIDALGRIWVSADEGLHNKLDLGNRVWPVVVDLID